MARLTNSAGANDNGGPTWADRRRRDSYGASERDESEDEDET